MGLGGRPLGYEERRFWTAHGLGISRDFTMFPK